MTELKAISFAYDPHEARVITDALGFSDSDQNGTLTRAEFNAADNTPFRAFLKSLPAETLATYTTALSRYTAASPITASALTRDVDLAAFTRDALRYRQTAFVEQYHLPTALDTTLFPLPAQQRSRLFDWIVLDIQSLQNDPTVLQALTTAGTTASSATAALLLQFMQQAPAETQTLQILRQDWDSAFTAWRHSHPESPLQSATSTWNEVLTMWYHSDTIWHTVHSLTQDGDPLWHVWMNDTVARAGSSIVNTLGITDRSIAMARLARPDMTITASGVAEFLDNPRGNITPPFQLHHVATNPLAQIHSTDAHVIATWPDEASRIDVAKAAGLNLHVDVDAGATVILNQKIRADALAFNVSEPLMRLEGFHFSADADNWFMRLLAGAVDLGHWPWGRTFDPLFHIKGITVYNNRICAVIQGQSDAESGGTNVTPIDDDYFILDLNGIIKPELDRLDPSHSVSRRLFDENGDLYANATVWDIVTTVQTTILKTSTLKTASNKTDSLLSKAEITLLNVEARANNMSVDLTALAQNLLPQTGPASLTGLRVTRGDVYARRDLKNDQFFAQGALDLALDIHSKFPGIGSKSDIPLHMEFFADGIKRNHDGKYVGWVTLSLEDFDVSGDSMMAGSYGGKIAVAVTMDDFSGLLDKGDPTALLETITVQALVDVQRNHDDFLVALLTGQTSDKVREATTLAERLKAYHIDYRLAVNDRNLPLIGFLQGEAFYGLETETVDPQDMAWGFTINNHAAVTGGLAHLFAKDTVIAIYKEPDITDATGTITQAGATHLLPRSQSVRAEGRPGGNASDLSGEIIITPVMENGRAVSHRIEVKNLGITIGDAEFLLTGDPEGKTEFDQIDKIARGKIERATLNGDFEVGNPDTDEEASIADILTVESWQVKAGQHAGLTIEANGADLRFFRADTEEEIEHHSVAGADLTLSVVDIGHLSLNPRGLAGQVGADLNADQVDWDLGVVRLSGDVRRGRVSVKGPVLPDVRFESPRSASGFASDGSAPASLVPHDPTPEQQAAIDTSLHGPHSPFVPVPKDEQPFHARNQIYRNLYAFLKQFAEFSTSIEGFDIEISDIDIFPDADHNETLCADGEKIPAEFLIDLKGAANLVQWALPLFPEGLAIDSDRVTITGSDQHLGTVTIGFKNNLHPDVEYFKWLGMKISSIEIAKPQSPLRDATASHVYFVTTSGRRVGLNWLLTLIKPKLVKRMRERLAEKYVQPALAESAAAQDLSAKQRATFTKHFGEWAQGKGCMPKRYQPVLNDVIDFHKRRFAHEFDITHPERTREDFIAHRLQQLYDDYRFSWVEIPDNIADLMTWGNEFVKVFGVARNLGKKKKPLAEGEEKSPSFLGTNEASYVDGLFDLRLRPFSAEAIGTRVTVTEENENHTNAYFKFIPEVPRDDGTVTPHIGIKVAHLEDDLLEHVSVVSDGFVDFEGELDELHGLGLQMDGKPKDGGTFSLGVEHMAVQDIGLQYAPGVSQSEFTLVDLTRKAAAGAQAGQQAPDDTEHPAGHVVIEDLQIGLVKLADGRYVYRSSLKIPDASVASGYLYVRQVADKAPLPGQETVPQEPSTREIGMNISGSTLTDFDIRFESKMFTWEERENPENKGVGDVDVSGTFSLNDRVGLKEGEPRAIIQIGETKSPVLDTETNLPLIDPETNLPRMRSTPEYLFVQDLIVQNVHTYAGNDQPIEHNAIPMGLEGDLTMTIDVPHYADQYLRLAQERAGITANISRITVDGTMKFDFSGPVGSIARFKLADGPSRPVTLKLDGDIAIHREGVDIRISDLVIPIDKFALEIVDGVGGTQGATLKEFATPGGEAITAGVDGTVHLPNSPLGERGLILRDGDMSISSSSGIGMSMADARNPSTLRTSAETGIADLHVRLAAGQNVLDIRTGTIFYKDGHGVIHDWKIDAQLRDYFYGTILAMKPLLSGQQLNIDVPALKP